MNNAFYYSYGQSRSCIGDHSRFEPFCLSSKKLKEYLINPKQGQRKACCIPSPKNLTGDLDLWAWKSIGFQILLRTKYVPGLVKVHWRMLILECSQGCWCSIFYSKLVNCILLKIIVQHVRFVKGRGACGSGERNFKFGSIFRSLPDFSSLLS